MKTPLNTCRRLARAATALMLLSGIAVLPACSSNNNGETATNTTTQFASPSAAHVTSVEEAGSTIDEPTAETAGTACDAKDLWDSAYSENVTDPAELANRLTAVLAKMKQVTPPAGLSDDWTLFTTVMTEYLDAVSKISKTAPDMDEVQAAMAPLTETDFLMASGRISMWFKDASC